MVDVDTDGTNTIDQSRLDAEPADLPAGTLTEQRSTGCCRCAKKRNSPTTSMWTSTTCGRCAVSQHRRSRDDPHRRRADPAGPLRTRRPGAGNAAGVFTNPDLQALYDELVDRGSESLVEALKVGALIEDLDIVDLRSLQTDTAADIATVYANLEKGSRNHLRAFISNLDRRGETYTPSYLSTVEFEEIVAAPPNEETAKGMTARSPCIGPR